MNRKSLLVIECAFFMKNCINCRFRTSTIDHDERINDGINDLSNTFEAKNFPQYGRNIYLLVVCRKYLSKYILILLLKLAYKSRTHK